MIKTYISSLIKETRGGAGVAGTQKRSVKTSGVCFFQAIILPVKERKMINVGWTARPSSILLSSLFGRH